ncbi:unnamed protein product [Phytophthora lilii]|uniref:Unnamed protein product n=1 Tax=Phytophthora lilii TaxID=2077276 RepID=A0A9W6TUJ4_9STRA|nr:unnamed protein product [Phytophthora lilii]
MRTTKGMQVVAGVLALVVCIGSGSSSETDMLLERRATSRLSRTLEMIRRGEVIDPVESLEMMYPVNGSVEHFPVQLTPRVNVRAGETELFMELYNGLSICFDMSNMTLPCFKLDEPWVKGGDWPVGHYTLQAYFSDIDRNGNPTGERHLPTLPISFSVVTDDAYAAFTAEFMHTRQPKYRVGYNISLVDWASQQQKQRRGEILSRLKQDHVSPLLSKVGHGMRADKEDLVLLIGVKTAVRTNFALRQAIRETWASKVTLPPDVKVLFVGCRASVNASDGSKVDSLKLHQEQRKLREAIALEKLVYRDMLTDELDCDDSYLDLANKVKEFLHVAVTQYRHAQFVMIADDDVYVRADKLVKRFKRMGPQTRYFSGQVPSIQNARKNVANRDPYSPHSLSFEQYPLSELPPMAMGAYYFMSMDCARFISKNRGRLRSLNGVDDITIPLWMLATQVHVKHEDDLGFLRGEPCSNRFVAFGDLSPLSLREVHSNLQENRSFCHGFDKQLWLKTTRHDPDKKEYRMLPWYPENLQFGFELQNVSSVDMLHVTSIVSTQNRAGVKVSYFPSNETFTEFSHRVCAEARLSFPAAANATSCSDLAILLKLQLSERLQALGKMDIPPFDV